MNLANNIWKLYLIKTSKWFMVYMPIVVLFMKSNGLDLRAVMLVNAVYSLSIAVFEIPSGYFSDRFGRKQSLVIGTLFISLQFVAYSLSYDFWGLVLGGLIGGIGASFISGTDSALLYDTLQHLNRTHDYLKWEGRTYALGTFSEAVAAILGGWVAYQYSLRSPMYVQVGISLIGVLAALTLVEPVVQRDHQRSNSEQMRYILCHLFVQNKPLRFFVGISTLGGLPTLLLAWFAQPYFETQQLPEHQIGYLWAALNSTVAVFSLTAHRWTGPLNSLTLVGIILTGFVGGYALLGTYGSTWVSAGLCSLFLMYALRGLATPTFLHLINQKAPADMRATILSIRGFLIRLGYATTAPLLGWVADVYTIAEVFMLLSSSIALLSGSAWGYYRWLLKK